ncbi:MAG: 50S ribosomal protein L11 methyltransferase [Candidatus Marinimicrobia bacterium]|nr:50S ribosomal protein L11 methyltransferase [Candidatus Neomarinimicrobiota bacterium]
MSLPDEATRRELLVLELEGPREELEICLAQLGELVTGALEQADNDGNPRLQVYLAARDRPVAEERLVTGRLSATWRPVPKEDWEVVWRKDFEPVTVTAGITIVPDWDTTTSARTLIRIRPGLAFGTGHHASTRLAIRALERLGCRGARVLDLGSGSGVLAIAASLLGAAQVVAVEHDLDCQGNFKDNLKLNSLPVVPRLVIGDVLEWTDFDCDLVLANINPKVVFPLLEHYCRTKSRASLIVSGLLTDDQTRLKAHCRSLGLTTRALEREAEWLCAVVQRRDKRTSGPAIAAGEID